MLKKQEVATLSGLDFSGKKQLYYQLYDILFQDIVNDAYSVGDYIPSETELMRQYGVSRATARKAMELLANNGLIKKRRGHGSEVIATRPNTSPNRVASYIKKGLADQKTPIKRTIESGIVPADALVSERLHIPAASDMFQLCRVRYSGEEPCYLETIQVERAYTPHALGHDFSMESWRSYLTHECKVRWSRAVQSIYAVVADEVRASLLQVEPGDPLVYIERISIDTAGIPREFVQTYYRADLYHLEIELDV
ncbi:GntR family transcriptional regulator [Collinsella sp. zg1085]|uniref:GntR family transcriptional regulator n=1 Tax=Collinsella sp. zg1085 TaxID=2844380 RepID=UPI001C0D7D25|nr:GntR family transcriptional regulator [Collinsella sp. zg1085]QWT17665.1 GntR family transcriptional regulator [Collinsella sp. zg1085]